MTHDDIAISRRSFCFMAAAVTVTPSLSLFAKSTTPTAAYDMIAAQDRTRILSAAHQYVSRPIRTITSFVTPRSPGGPHDFFSQADYFWPDPKNPNAPYINRDGQSNPDNFNDHRKVMIRLSIEMPALTAAWLLLRSDKNRAAEAHQYLRHACDHLRAWFMQPETRMNPNLEFAQGVHGISTGRNYGIIDTLHLVEVARAASIAAPANLTQAEQTQLHTWFRDYLHWMTTSEKGIKERDTINNHAVCWALQASEFARLIGDTSTRDEIRTRYRTIFLPGQMGPDGSFPKELTRTKPYSYSIFNFDVMAGLCQSLEERSDSPRSTDLFLFSLADGRGICKAAAFLYPYLKNKANWPYAHDVEHFEFLPVRSPGLLFSGVHCKQPDYISLWRTLNPDPEDPEIIRNYPIRQPLLWFVADQD